MPLKVGDRFDAVTDTPPATGPGGNGHTKSAPPDAKIVNRAEPLRIAENLINRRYRKGGVVTLRRYEGEWFSHTGIHYERRPEEAIESEIWGLLDTTHVRKTDKKGKDYFEKLVPKKAFVAEVKAALTACGTMIENTPPAWLIDRTGYDPKNILPTQSGLLHLPNRELIPPTAEYFSRSAVPFDYDPEAPEPVMWQMFLESILADDPDQVDLLQEWIGYCLTADTSQQKILFVVSPPRGGKGTIARILTRLLGPQNVCAPTLSSLATSFGLQPLIGKSLAIISDARLTGRPDTGVIVERLLSVSGEDLVTIDRKHLGSVDVRLNTRIVLMSNELPRLGDSSGALANRFVIVSMDKSFLGREDHGLESRLIAELPSILLWAIDGWERLNDRGHFVMPEKSKALLEEIEELSSPVKAFVRDCCTVDPEGEISINALFQEWKNWSDRNGSHSSGTKQRFGRDMRSALPNLRISYRRDGDDRQRFYEGIRLK